MIYRVFISIFILGLSALGHSQTWYEQLEHSLKQTLAMQIEAMAGNMELEVYDYGIDLSYLNSRLNFQPCQIPLNIDAPQPLELGRSHIKVACKDTKPWALNVPTEVNLYTEVVVLNQPLIKNQIIEDGHIDLQRQNLAELRNGYYLKKAQVIGKQSKRALSGQTVLNSYLILPALMIHKGDKVMITANKGPMSVKMPGEALNDGREGRQIRVKNNRSERIIRGKVVGPGEVLVQF
ncbi:flagellar basal body P-ring formation chaperone FlgA [Oceaniserpentilla sp. 4NH20-0058]